MVVKSWQGLQISIPVNTLLFFICITVIVRDILDYFLLPPPPGNSAVVPGATHRHAGCHPKNMTIETQKPYKAQGKECAPSQLTKGETKQELRARKQVLSNTNLTGGLGSSIVSVLAVGYNPYYVPQSHAIARIMQLSTSSTSAMALGHCKMVLGQAATPSFALVEEPSSLPYPLQPAGCVAN